MMVSIDVKLIKIFVAVATNRSFTLAAEELHLAQPWLSVQVRKFEDILGFVLFRRNRNQNVDLTPKATALLPAAVKFLDSYDKLIGETVSIRRGDSSSLLLGALEFTASIPGRQDLIGRLHAAYPDMDIEIINGHSTHLLSQLRSGQLDAAFVLGPLPHAADLDTLVVAKPRLSLLVPDNHPFARIEQLRMEMLEGLSVANFRRKLNPPVYDYIFAIMEDYGVSIVNLPESSLRGAQLYVLNERIPVLMTDWMDGPFVDPPGAHLCPIVECPIDLQCLLVRRSNDQRTLVAALWNYTLQLFETKQPDSPIPEIVSVAPASVERRASRRAVASARGKLID